MQHDNLNQEIRSKGGKARQASMSAAERKMFARSGAIARAQKLTPERRKEIAAKARAVRAINFARRKAAITEQP